MTTPLESLATGIAFTGNGLDLGRPLLDGRILTDTPVRIPLSMLNRHGLIAGATGTGKTRTLQMMADSLSAAGVPVFLADVKGDLSGCAAPGLIAQAEARMRELDIPWTPTASPVEFLSLGGAPGAPVRVTPAGFGPLLLSKVLRLNETQESVLSLIFRWCDDKGLLILDLEDLRAVLAHLRDNADEIAARYGEIASATVNVILRKILDLEDEAGAAFFGEPEFEVADLLRVVPDGRGIVTILNVADLQNRPRVFATFMMWLLSELYDTLPEVGDAEKPKLVFFLDEAHLLFDEASPEFLERVQRVIRLIRSKGVGVFFVTQNPTDLPDEILGQLGTRVQHALPAFTPKDRRAIKSMAENFPSSDLWDVETMMTTTGVGEALVSVVGPTGAPLPTVVARIAAPASLMGPLDVNTMSAIIAASPLADKYRDPVNRESAAESLGAEVPPVRSGSPVSGSTAASPAETAPVPDQPHPAWKPRLSAEDQAIEDTARKMANADDLLSMLESTSSTPVNATSSPDPKPESPGETAPPGAARTAAASLYDDLLNSALGTVPAAKRQMRKGRSGQKIMGDIVRTAGHEVTRQIVRGIFGTWRR